MSYALLCPGQGGQHADMLRLLAGNKAAHAVFDAAHAALGYDVRELMAQGDALFRNAFAQPLLCVSELATWSALRELLPAPAAIAGYSVGELAAYGCADALDAPSLAALAATRARLMDAAAPALSSGLIALRGLRRDALAALCAGQEAWIAIATGDDGFVVGGRQGALDTIADVAQRGGAQITCLKVGIASHTPLLQSAVAPFRNALQESDLRAPRIPVVAGIDAGWVRHRARAVESLSQQLAHTVEWASCLDALVERGCRVCLELGPGSALARMMRERHADVEARSVEEFRSLAAAAKWVLQRLPPS